ncbi:MAG: YceI family protein [Chloroflexi bacterium]|nr:YceI family protein [Chloroflexota bacterium]
MLEKVLPIGLLAIAVAVGGAGYVALKAPAQPSASIQAIPVELQGAPTAETAGTKIFVIQSGTSTASFSVDEILAGSPNTVVGTTSQVAGQLALDPMQPDAAQLGTILVNARGLVTDDNQRNRMIQNFILSTGNFEYVSFTPTVVNGLPTSLSLGVEYPLQITGQLTIRDVTSDVTFDARVTPVSTTEVRGLARVSISSQAWGISIPRVPLVASVSDDVRLDLNFVAIAAA